MGDVKEFLNMYQDILEQAIAQEGIPEQILEEYTFESCIKKDDNKELYIIQSKSTSKQCLLKIAVPKTGESPLAEAAILKKLDHPSIPKVLLAMEQDGKEYLVREYFEGQPLNSFIATNGPLSPADALSVAKRLCETLGFLHGQNPPIIHRDIKPQNLILAPDGSLKLIDFGIARDYKEDTDQDTVFIGTRPYAPPEQHGYAQTTPVTDIYAVGIVTLFLMTGSANRNKLTEKVKSARCRKLIEKCIAFDPEARFQNADQIIKAIDHIRNTNRRRVFIGSLIGLVVILSGVLFYQLGILHGQTGIITTNGEGSPSPINTVSPSVSPSSDETDNSSRTDSWTPNPEGISIPFDNTPYLGNLPGNINCRGLAVQGDDAIYFANKNNVCRMNNDGGNIEILANIVEAQSLNYVNGTLYCSSKMGIHRIDPATGEAKLIFNGVPEYVTLYEDQFYFKNSEDGLKLYRIDIDGANLEKVNDLKGVMNFNIYKEKIYFCYEEDERRLYSANLDGSDLTPLYDREGNWITVMDDVIYFSDFTPRRGMTALSIDGGDPRIISGHAASYSVVTPYGIFYENGSSYSLDYVSLDGNISFMLVKADVARINVAGGWVFYINEDDGDSLWMVRVDGSQNQRL